MNSFSREMSLYLAIYISISSNLICITMISTAPGISTGCSYYTTAVTSSIMRVEMSVMSHLFWIWSVNASPDDESKWIKQMCCQNFQLSGAIVIKWVFVLLDLSSHSCQGCFFFSSRCSKTSVLMCDTSECSGMLQTAEPTVWEEWQDIVSPL